MLRMCLCAFTLLTSCSPIPRELEIVARHVQTRPRMQIEDVYKLLYQSSQGIGHFLTDTTAVLSYLHREIETLAPHDGTEPLVEPIRSDSALVRINLRPYVAGGGSVDSLFQAMLVTDRTHKPNVDEFKRLWNRFVTCADRFGYTTTAADSFDQHMKTGGYPAVHHSAAYAEAYQPAYRVLTREALQNLTH